MYSPMLWTRSSPTTCWGLVLDRQCDRVDGDADEYRAFNADHVCSEAGPEAWVRSHLEDHHREAIVRGLGRAVKYLDQTKRRRWYKK